MITSNDLQDAQIGVLSAKNDLVNAIMTITWRRLDTSMRWPGRWQGSRRGSKELLNNGV